MNIVISGNYGAQNLGDELILHSLLQQLKEKYPQANLTVLSGNPAQTSLQHQVNALPMVPAGIRSSIKSLFNNQTTKALAQADYFILGGGGLFTKLSKKANHIWLKQGHAALKNNVKLLMLGQSLDFYPNNTIKQKIINLFNQAHAITLRDQASIQRLKKAGVTKTLKYAPDFALNPFPKTFKRTKQLLVALRGDRFSPHSPETQKITELLRHYQNQGYQLLFVNFHPTQDHPYHLHLAKTLNIAPENILTPSNHQQVHELFAKSQTALTMRLHAAILAINTKTSFSAISYANKVKDLLTSLNLQPNLLDINSTTPAKHSFPDVTSSSHSLSALPPLK